MIWVPEQGDARCPAIEFNSRRVSQRPPLRPSTAPRIDGARVIAVWRWPNGFVCPACGGTDDCTIGPRRPGAGFKHGAINTDSGRKTPHHPAFKRVNTTLGNIKNAITGTYRTLRKKHMVRNLDQLEWGFNQHFDPAAMIDYIGRAAINTKPALYWGLKMSDFGT